MKVPYFSSVPTKVLYFSSVWCGQRKLTFPKKQKKQKKYRCLGSARCQSGLDPHRRHRRRGEEGGLQPLPLGRGRATANRAWNRSICRRCRGPTRSSVAQAFICTVPPPSLMGGGMEEARNWSRHCSPPAAAAISHRLQQPSSLNTALGHGSASPMLSEGGGRRPAATVVARSRVATARASIHTPPPLLG
jgi:hypothetical protein